MTGFDFDDLEREEVRVYKPLVVHEDAEEAAGTTSGPTQEILWHSTPEIARAVSVFGPGCLARPLLSRVVNVGHQPDSSIDWENIEANLRADFGGLDPQRLTEELTTDQVAFHTHVEALSDQELRTEVQDLQAWHVQAQGRLRTLERRAAWAILGIPVTKNRIAIARAFKRRALELHPDKGGDAARFQLLQELKDLLLARDRESFQDDRANDAEAEAEAHADEDQQSQDGASQEDGESSQDEEESDGDSDVENDEDEEGDLREKRRKRRRRKRRKPAKKEESEDELVDLPEDVLDRERYGAARHKLRRSLAACWERAGRLSREVGLAGRRNPGSRAVREFRKFTDTFASREGTKLRKGQPEKAEALLHSFLGLGTEMLCAAGAVDAVATVSEVAMKVTGPLLATAESRVLRLRCSELLDAIEELAAGCRTYSAPVERAAVQERDESPEQPASTPLEARQHAEEPSLTLSGEDSEVSETEAKEAGIDETSQAPADVLETDDGKEAEAATPKPPQEGTEPPSPSGPGAAEEPAPGQHHQDNLAVVAASKEKGPEQRLRPLRTKWDLFWDHPCAGDRRDDGSGIFCLACDTWVLVGDPYDHQIFEQHCQKVGHENWIYGRVGEHAPAIGY